MLNIESYFYHMRFSRGSEDFSLVWFSVHLTPLYHFTTGIYILLVPRINNDKPHIVRRLMLWTTKAYHY
ncbi:hypothetical protein BDV30DRAFT_204196 [Aspergillus minisclerotigenes]|uniref:Uncharacterized protein n=1 Tax=Aspergillus minisclerotigenes TaxID=656917 RepID=A0A5N6JJS2_9EURO|nr:hypothetical protein BDV30DRAFT_204196 [Aspergillus minisclerotigenes]